MKQRKYRIKMRFKIVYAVRNSKYRKLVKESFSKHAVMFRQAFRSDELKSNIQERWDARKERRALNQEVRQSITTTRSKSL